ncbi:hypothetical protein CSKR_111840 [Clonorchis sinensis]|uniref:Uncharacterized protein n=1 Tax=Clonorchis sinensis TaxID=79923 RepID=A0A3R7GSM1_CLOSI|nr:hypothetical protein CSKR_111840 [Clonorchis sinensis]
MLHQAASVFNWYDVRDIAIHLPTGSASDELLPSSSSTALHQCSTPMLHCHTTMIYLKALLYLHHQTPTQAVWIETDKIGWQPYLAASPIRRSEDHAVKGCYLSASATLNWAWKTALSSTIDGVVVGLLNICLVRRHVGANGPVARVEWAPIKKSNHSAIAPFRRLTAMPSEESTGAGILPGCPSLDRGSREAEVGSNQDLPSVYLVICQTRTLKMFLIHALRSTFYIWLEREFIDRKIRDSNLIAESRLPLYRLGQLDSITALMLSPRGMAARHRKGVTTERFFCFSGSFSEGQVVISWLMFVNTWIHCEKFEPYDASLHGLVRQRKNSLFNSHERKMKLISP